MSDYYEMDDPDRELVAKVREAVGYVKDGDPLKDFLDEEDIVEALELLVNIADTGYAK